MEARNIRNIAIIAHVDHGKTTLVDFLLKQSHTFRDNQLEMSQTTIMDSGDLERERGITIRAKNTAVRFGGYKINIIDTPGHADFSGEVERTLGMADGAILIVDAQEGPMPQTRFVLARALKLGLKVMVVINKIDKRDARVEAVRTEIDHLFLDLARTDAQLDFPVFYAIARTGKAWASPPTSFESPATLNPLFESIIAQFPAPGGDPRQPFQLLVSALAWDSYQGKYAVGRVARGTVHRGNTVTLLRKDGTEIKGKIDKIFVSEGLERVEADSASAGEVVHLTGISEAHIGETIASADAPEALPVMEIEPPTLQVLIGPNTSPFAAREGKFTTSRQIATRLQQELETNVSLRVEEQDTTYLVSGRGELHLSVLIETLRREGFELEVGQPTVVTRTENGRLLEPVEELIVEVPEEYTGAVTSELGRRRAVLKEMQPAGQGVTQIIYHLPTRALLGLRNSLLTATKGSAVLNSLLIGYEPLGPALPKLRNGVLISAETGISVTYGLKVVEERGTAFVGPGTRVYEGMIIGLNRRGDDMEINACKEKKQTNIRSSNSDIQVALTPFTNLSLEQALDFIEADELLEVTPESLRLRKRHLTELARKRTRQTA